MTYCKDGDFIDAFDFVVWPLDEVFVDIFEVGYRHIFLKFFVQSEGVIDEFNLAVKLLKPAYSTMGDRALKRIFSRFHYKYLSILLMNRT